MEEADENGAEQAPKKVHYQYCPFKACDYRTKSRNLGKHVNRWHHEEKTPYRSQRVTALRANNVPKPEIRDDNNVDVRASDTPTLSRVLYFLEKKKKQLKTLRGLNLK